MSNSRELNVFHLAFKTPPVLKASLLMPLALSIGIVLLLNAIPLLVVFFSYRRRMTHDSYPDECQVIEANGRDDDHERAAANKAKYKGSKPVAKNPPDDYEYGAAVQEDVATKMTDAPSTKLDSVKP